MSSILRTIPYNLYAILTIIMLIVLAIAKFDYGPMAKHELNAIQNGDLFTTEGRPYGDDTVADEPKKGASLWDMVLPVIVLIVFCIIGLIYTGGFFEGNTFAL